MSSTRIAALPMYGIDRDAVDDLWSALTIALRAEGLRDVPDWLDWPDDLAAHWRDPGLLVSQTCGYPLVDGLDDHVRVVGAFRYDAEGASGSHYSSLVVVRTKDTAATLEALRGKTAAINSRDSHSGANALRGLIAPIARSGRFFGAVLTSGSHRASLAAVRDGSADVAAIDCISFALIAEQEPDAVAGLRILARTPLAPGLPLVTARTTSDDELERIRRALERLVTDPALAELRAPLLIAGFDRLGRADYAPIAAVRDAAVAAGYPELA